MKTVLSFLLICCLVLSLHAAEGYRTLTSTDGRTINAKPVAIIGNKVRIQREDGMEFNVLPSQFSEEDKAFLAKWCIGFLIDSRRFIKIGTDQSSDLSGRTKSALTVTTYYYNGGTSTHTDSNGILTKTYDKSYEITLEGESDMAFGDLRIDYIATARSSFYDFEDEQYKKGTFDNVTLMPREEIVLVTEPFAFEKIKYKGYADPDVDFRFTGIWLKIYHKDELIYEYSQPSSIKDRCNWDDPMSVATR